MAVTTTHTFTHDATEAGVATCDTDVLNENLEYLKEVQDQKADISPNITTLPTSGTVPLQDNRIYSVTPTADITFSLPSLSTNTSLHQMMVQLNKTTSVTINLGTTDYFNKIEPDFTENGRYNLYYEWDGTSWVVGSIEKGPMS